MAGKRDGVHAAAVGVTFALCREFMVEGGRLRGLNREYCTAENCEGRWVVSQATQLLLS